MQTAIEVLEHEKECIKRNIRGCDRNCGACDLVLPDDVILKAFDKGIEALQEAEARKKGCQFCTGLSYHPVFKTDEEIILYATNGFYSDGSRVKLDWDFCPKCGRKLK